MPSLDLSLVEIAYVAFVLGIGGAVLWRTLAYLGHLREGRLQRLSRRQRFDPVPTATPLANPKEVATHRGAESIERHFTVMRRLLAPLVAGFTLLLASIPILSAGAASTAAVIGGVLAAVVGFAARPFLENAMAGLAISGSGLLRIGDTVRIDEDYYGTVEDITATHTAVKLWDWRRYLVPNAAMLQRSVLNHSLYDTFEWAHVDIWVEPQADLDLVREIAVEAARASTYRTGGEDPYFWVKRLEKDAVCCSLAAWAATATAAWALRSEMREHILAELGRRGIATMRGHLALERPSGPRPRATRPPGPELASGSGDPSAAKHESGEATSARIAPRP